MGRQASNFQENWLDRVDRQSIIGFPELETKRKNVKELGRVLNKSAYHI